MVIGGKRRGLSPDRSGGDCPQNIDKVIIALDVNDKQTAQQLIDQLTPPISFYKVGLELYTGEGNAIIKLLKEQNLRIFLDLKLHDIPNTVAKTVANLAKYKPDMFTAHVLGGRKMLEAAVKVAREVYPRTKVLGVTILTSLDQNALKELGISEKVEHLVTQLAQAAFDSGCDGIVCSANDLSFLRSKFPPPFLLVAPGIRLPEDKTDDQLRTATANEALEKGADYLVVGRSITAKKQPAEALNQLF